METDNSELDLSVMKDFDRFVSEFTNNANADVPTLDEDIEDLIGIPYDDLLKLTSEQCLAKSIKMSGYAMYVQAQVNQNQARLNWCEDVLNHVISKEYFQYDSFIKHEVKRHAIINQNSFAEKVEKLRSRLKARVTVLDGKLGDIRHMAEVLSNLGKRKGYNEHS